MTRELRSTAGGTQILSFGVAVNDRRRNQQTGEWEDVPNFVDCVVFGQRAEALSRFLSKGSKVAIEGKLRFSSWETKEGQRRSKLEVVVDEVEFLSRNQQGGAPMSQGAPSYAAPTPQAPAPVPAPPDEEFYDADIPFLNVRQQHRRYCHLKGKRHGSAETRFSSASRVASIASSARRRLSSSITKILSFFVST